MMGAAFRATVTVDVPALKHRIRFGHHKCLTGYFNRIFVENRHFCGRARDFIQCLRKARSSLFVSLNNKVVDPTLPILRDAKMFHDAFFEAQFPGLVGGLDYENHRAGEGA